VNVDISSWSPSSTRLIYAVNRWRECGRTTPSAALYMTGPRGNAPDKLLAAQTDGDFSTAAWSPDERRVAFNQCDLQASVTTCPLVVMETASRKRRLLARDSYPGTVVWAEKTNEILALRAEPDSDIWAFKADGSGRRLLTRSTNLLAASADGNRLLLYLGGGARKLIDVETGTARLLPSAAGRRFGKGAIAHFLR
jgi:dipeptidyl aminopeptidase/acylaminoacyl peptidase